MNSKLYVGNLPFRLEESKLEEIFTQYGTVKSVRIITDRDTGRSKGFGFIEMGSSQEAQEAIDNLDGNEVEGRNIRVNRAQEKGPRGGGGGGGGKRW